MTPLQFGRLQWHPDQRRLLVDGVPTDLGSRAFDLLSTLIEHRDRIVGKDELLSRVWGGVVVEENNLTVQVAKLRRIVGADAIITVPGRGYRWSAPVSAEASLAGDAPGAAGGAPGPVPMPRPAISVLPFANPGGDPHEEYLADGLAEDIAAGLARSPWLFVIAQDSARTFRDSALPPAELCRRLGAQYLVRGSVRRARGRLRVSAELLHGKNAEVLLAERYDRPADDLFALQDELTERIVATVEPLFLKHEATQATARGPRDLRHWELLMRARWHYWRSSRSHLAEARQLLAEALARRPDDVAALSMLAFCLTTEVWSGWSADAKATAHEAQRLAQRAVALDDRDAFAHFTLGVTLAGFGLLDRAIAEQRLALALHPHFAAAAGELGRLLAFAGETAEARLWTRRAMAASPTEPRVSLWLFGLAIADFVDGDFAAAVRHSAQAVAHRPDWFFNHYLLAASHACAAEPEAARAALAEGERLLPDYNIAAMRVGHPFRHDAPRERYVQALKSLGWKG